MIKWFLALLLIFPCCLTKVLATEGWHIAVGYSADDIRYVRLAYRAQFETFSAIADKLHSNFFIESSYNYMDSTIKGNSGISILGISPVLQWPLIKGTNPLFLELGIGVALLDRTQINDRRLGTHFQFEDMLRLSWQSHLIANTRVSLALIHYSNGGINRYNSGVDLLSLMFSIAW